MNCKQIDLNLSEPFGECFLPMRKRVQEMYRFNLTNLTRVFRHLLTFAHLYLSRFLFIAELQRKIKKRGEGAIHVSES